MINDSLLTPTISPGLSSSGSTRPGTGKKIVYLLEVFTTTHFLIFFTPLVPSSSSIALSSISKTSMIFETKYGSFF